MARKKRVEEHENHERWLVSYADFITLLFAFFVVMYSMSSVNEGKYRVLSASMVAAFNPSARSLIPVQVGELVRSPPTPIPVIRDAPIQVNISPITIASQSNGNPFYIESEAAGEASRLEEAAAQFNSIASDVMELFEQLIDNEQILVRKYPYWLEIEIKSNILFTSGSAEHAESAEAVLQRIAGVLENYSNRIVVEGFTDNNPINSLVYPSNWELSSARAARVIRSLEVYGIMPQRMMSVGYGEIKPTDDNSTEAGRAANRRVIIVVMANVSEPNLKDEISSEDLDLLRLRSSN